jgi:hypothetical protein
MKTNKIIPECHIVIHHNSKCAENKYNMTNYNNISLIVAKDVNITIIAIDPTVI